MSEWSRKIAREWFDAQDSQDEADEYTPTATEKSILDTGVLPTSTVAPRTRADIDRHNRMKARAFNPITGTGDMTVNPDGSYRDP